VVPIDAYVRDRATAALTAKAYHAVAVVYQPKVIRVKDKTLLCISLFLRETEGMKTYPPLPAEIEKSTLAEISGTLLAILGPTDVHPNDSIASRVAELERQVAALNSAVFRSTSQRQVVPDRGYASMRAIVIGLNHYATNQLPRLSGAVADAHNMVNVLVASGFRTTLLTDENATQAAIEKAIDEAVLESQKDSLTVIYYGGMSFRSSDTDPKSTPDALVLSPYDVQLEHPLQNITLSDLVERMRKTNGDTLIIVDGCHGTFGLSSADSNKTSSDRSTGIIQVITGAQDTEVSLDLPDGGAFTQAILKQLRAQALGQRISTNELIARVSPDVTLSSQGSQHPKLLTVSGKDDIFLPGLLSTGSASP
jgi:hypothetical protein